jgi:phosphatidylglycerol:prolipoprotein diacylglycerol transferase
MHPVLLSLGWLHIYSYGFMVALGFLIGIIIITYQAKGEGVKPEIIVDGALYVIIASIIGARLFYVIGEWEQYRDNLKEIIMVQNGGLVFLGGLILAVLTVIWYARWKKQPLLKLLDLSTPGVALGYAIGRLGCFFNGCCFGLPTKLPWGVSFPSGSLAYSYFGDERLHPTQLYSSLIMLVFALVLFLIFKKKRYPGQVFYWGILLYAIYRFSVEFLRYSPMHWFYLTPSQWIVLIAGGLAIFGLLNKQRAKIH